MNFYGLLFLMAGPLAYGAGLPLSHVWIVMIVSAIPAAATLVTQ
jgi:hypothetical protein